MAAIHEGANYVVCWEVDGRLRFEHFEEDGWASARALFEELAEYLAPLARLLAPPYGDLSERGGGIPPTRRIPVGVFNAHRVERHALPDLFVCVGRGRALIPILGPADSVELKIAVVRREGAPCRRYTQRSVGERNATPTPPSELTYSVGARHALERALADEAQTPLVLADLPVGELIWLSDAARTRDRLGLAHEAATLAVRRRRTPGTLNLLGAVLRSRHEYQASIESFTESIEICRTARSNPYAFVGLAATFRRLGRYDEAWDLLKGPLKHYPDDEKALNVRAALKRDFGMEGAA